MSEIVDLVNLMGPRVSRETTLVMSVRECLVWVSCEKTNTVWRHPMCWTLRLNKKEKVS